MKIKLKLKHFILKQYTPRNISANKANIKYLVSVLKAGKYKHYEGILKNGEGVCFLAVAALEFHVCTIHEINEKYTMNDIANILSPILGISVKDLHDLSLLHNNGYTFEKLADFIKTTYLS